tara:strand:- start:216 stop:404 length:189 start_codon:yes stop_codon:yes gene_type:complete
MTKENKLRQEIINKFNMQPSLLKEVDLTNSTEQKNKFFNELKDFINFIRSCCKYWRRVEKKY